MGKQKRGFHLIPHHKGARTIHWTDSREMHRVIRKFPGLFRAILLELLDQPMTRHEMRDFLSRFAKRRMSRKITKVQLALERHLNDALDLKVLEEKNGRYHLTPGGLEIATHMNQMIPVFTKWVFSARSAALLSIWVHILLSFLKLGAGFLSGSAGLTADGIDNLVDTLSSFLVWLGIKYDKEKLVSFFILSTMFLSVGAVALTTIDKFVDPEPVREGIMAFSVSALCGLIMLGLSSYQYVVGKKQSNLAVMSQAVDSRNHFWASLLVCGGILLSYPADLWNAPWLSYADAAASGIIGLLILRGAVELLQELMKKGGDEVNISHFMKGAEERSREKVVFRWLTGYLKSTSQTIKELEERFLADLCEQTPKLMIITGMGYQPGDVRELHRHLDRFVETHKLLFDEGRYWLISD